VSRNSLAQDVHYVSTFTAFRVTTVPFVLSSSSLSAWTFS